MSGAAPTALPWLLAICAAAPVLLAGCDQARSPFGVSRSRHPEYYEDLPQAPPGELASEPADPPPRETAGAPDLAELPGDTVEVSPADENGPGRPLDLRAARLTAAVRIDVNDPQFTDRLDPLFDGDTGTLSRTEDVNPLILQFRFQEPIQLVGVRIFPSYSTYDWAVRPRPEAPRLMVRGAAEERWSRIDLGEAVETAEVRFEVRRLVRDNYVHVNEVEILVEEE